ncbi:hypothetical protein WG66_006409 [Moniliophthora roreri]|nr:hypothetical protein WG66_006409 [Moniliophthora roreri]
MMELEDEDLHLEWCSECQRRVLGICRHTPNGSSDDEPRTHRNQVPSRQRKVTYQTTTAARANPGRPNTRLASSRDGDTIAVGPESTEYPRLRKLAEYPQLRRPFRQ